MGQCTATAKHTGERCKRFCRPGKTVCKWHGGASTGPPKGSKNALKTGQYEKIFPSCMTQDELTHAADMNTTPFDIIEQEIVIIRTREIRMMKRLRAALDAEAEAEKKMVNISASRTQTAQGDTTTVNSEAHAVFILRLESALTSIQHRMCQLVEQKNRILAEQGIDPAKNNSGVLVVPGVLSGEDWAEAARLAVEKKRTAEHGDT